MDLVQRKTEWVVRPRRACLCACHGSLIGGPPSIPTADFATFSSRPIRCAAMLYGVPDRRPCAAAARLHRIQTAGRSIGVDVLDMTAVGPVTVTRSHRVARHLRSAGARRAWTSSSSCRRARLGLDRHPGLPHRSHARADASSHAVVLDHAIGNRDLVATLHHDHRGHLGGRDAGVCKRPEDDVGDVGWALQDGGHEPALGAGHWRGHGVPRPSPTACGGVADQPWRLVTRPLTAGRGRPWAP